MSRHAAAAIIAFALAGASPSSARPVEDRGVAREAVDRFLTALSNGDERAFNAVTTPGYRAFENGYVYDRKGFYELVRKAIRDGMKPKFRVTDARSTVGDRVAAINYVSHGSFRSRAGLKDIAWLESVTLVRSDAGWQIDFLESHVRATESPR